MLKMLFRLGTILFGLWASALAWILLKLFSHDVQQTLAQSNNKAPRGVTMQKEEESEHFTRCHKIEDGIEWISYYPKNRKHQTPILMQHGMWHGAWCWQGWQELLAEWGWESHAISQPGHALSPVQEPIRFCTLDYYLSFIRDAVNKLERKPILMGHSMGGALTQWYLRYIGNLPGAVLVAPWALVDGFVESGMAFFKLDLVGCFRSGIYFKADFVRTPQVAAAALLSPNAILSPEDFQAKLNDESLLVMMQHALPWKVPDGLTTPMLWLAGEKDAVIPEPAERRSAAAYHADYRVYKGAAHNLMMEPNYRDIAQDIHQWLESKQIA